MRTSTPELGLGETVQDLIRRLQHIEWIQKISHAHDKDVSFLITLTDTGSRTKTIPVRVLDPQHAQSVRQSKRGKKIILLFVAFGRSLKDLFDRLMNSLQTFRRPRRKRVEENSDRFTPYFDE